MGERFAWYESTTPNHFMEAFSTHLRYTGILVQIKEALQPDGLFLGAMFGGETLFELRYQFKSCPFLSHVILL
jgi:hypothetical protein